jgi:hypothetical protein
MTMKTRSKRQYPVEHSENMGDDLQHEAPCSRPAKRARKFHNYDFVADRSWLPKRCTLERASRVMQKAISQSEHPPGMDYIWVDDLKDQHERVLPSAHRERERTSNSFLQYRVLVQRAFTGQQTMISKEIESLWRSETKEMQFQCYRNSEIENRISLSLKTD